MATATINVDCTNAQYDFLRDTSGISAFVGGIGSGKTFAGALKALMMPEGTVGTVVAPTYPMLRDATFKTFHDIARPLIRKFNETRFITTLRNGTDILWRSGDDPDRLRGPNLNWFWMDEGAYCHESVFDVMLGRIRKDPAYGWVTSSPNRKNWLYRAFGPQNQYGYKLYRASTRDNHHLPKAYVDALINRYSTSFAQQEIEGEFVDFEGARVKREWLRYGNAPEGLTYSIGVDLAASQRDEADYTAIVVTGYDGQGTYYVVDVFRTKATFNDIIRSIKMMADKWQPQSVCVESVQSQAYVVQELTRQYMLPIQPVYPNRDKVSRFMGIEGKIEHGHVVMVPGLDRAFEDELLSFPHGQHDDMVDAMVYSMLGHNNTNWVIAL